MTDRNGADMTGAREAEIKNRLNAAIDALWPLARKHNVEPVCWIGGDDEGVDWCRRCAEKEVARLNEGGADVVVDGGYDLGRESDGMVFCDKCDQPLGYTLTRYGVLEEPAHFIENGIGTVTPDIAYAICAVIKHAVHIDNDKVLVADALRTGETAASLVGFDPELARLADDGNVSDSRWP